MDTMSNSKNAFVSNDPYEVKKAEIKGLLTLPSVVLRLVLKGGKCSKPAIKDALKCLDESVKLIVELRE